VAERLDDRRCGAPQIVGSAAGGAGLICGIDPFNASNVIFGAFVTDASGTSHTVSGVSVLRVGIPHYVVATFDPTGTLSIWVDNTAIVTAGPFTSTLVNTLQANQWQIGQNQVSSSSYFGGSILRIDTWCRNLSPATEIPLLQAFYVTIGGF
jgi:hypothetical protein